VLLFLFKSSGRHRDLHSFPHDALPIWNNGTVTTKKNTAITPNASDIYDLYIFSRPNSSQIEFELRNAVTNAVLSTNTEISNLPLNTTFMYMQSHIQAQTVGTAKLLALNRMYLESNL